MGDLPVTVGLVLAVAGLGFGLVLTERRVAFVGLLTAVLLFQNISVMALLRVGLVQAEGAQVLLAAKEVLLAAAVLALALRALPRLVVKGTAKRSWFTGVAIAWIMLVLLHAVASGPPWLPRLAGARAVFILPALFVLGYWLAPTEREMGRLVRVVFVVAGCLAVFGLVEAYVLPPSFWLSIGHEEYYQVKIGRPIQGALYGNMRYWLAGQPIRRVASLTGDPLISSYPMAFGLVLIAARYLQRRRFRYEHLLAALGVGAATLLTLSRGAVLSVAIALGLLLVAGRSRTLFALLTTTALTGMVVAATLFGQQLLRITSGAGHIDQLVEGLARGLQRPFGHGLGTAGSVATGVARSSGLGGVVLGGGDSYMGSLATQMGLPATLLFYALMIWVACRLYARFALALTVGLPHAWWYGATAAMLAGLVATSALNESGFGFVASGVTMVLAGALASPALAVPTVAKAHRGPARAEVVAGAG